jgi:hypothetical protein
MRPVILFLLFWSGAAASQEILLAEPAQIAFEEGRWEDAIREYGEILEALPEDRMSWLRIAQAERELGRYDSALGSLEKALANNAPEATVHLERARNLLGLGRNDEAMAELEMADHLELRARVVLEEAADLDPLRDERRFDEIYRSVRSRVFPCEGIPEASEFDFWVGRWDVRSPDGTPLGESTITRDVGGCVIRENWAGTPGSSGASMTFYLPSRSQWRHIWIGSAGTHIDLTGELIDGEMRMEGTIEYLGEDEVIAFRATWTQGAGGLVRQHMEQFDLVARTWDPWFDGFYRRID